eukprot:2714892-Rhodomonas_salina.2
MHSALDLNRDDEVGVRHRREGAVNERLIEVQDERDFVWIALDWQELRDVRALLARRPDSHQPRAGERAMFLLASNSSTISLGAELVQHRSTDWTKHNQLRGEVGGKRCL